MIDEQGSVVHEVRFPHPVERVWDAIVDPDALAQWLMPNDFEPRVGHRFHFDAGPPRGEIEAEVLEVDAPHRMRLRWMIDDTPTTVTITLRADDGGTVLRLEHAGIPSDPRPDFDTGWVEKFEAMSTLLQQALPEATA
jgi:uncharacterized protein YndB with AHSA1/START domain